MNPIKSEGLPDLPKPRYIEGQAGRNTVRWGLGYNEADMNAHGLVCYEAGRASHAAPSATSLAEAAEAGQVEARDGLVAAFPHIALGHGLVEIGDATWEGLPALFFGKNGAEVGPIGSKRVRNNPAQDGETLALITFSNLKGLEQVEDALGRVRRNMEASPQAPAPQAVVGEASEPTEEQVDRALAEYNLALQSDPRNTEQGRQNQKIVDGMRKTAMWEAIRAALTPSPAPSAAPQEASERFKALETALIAECERAMRQRDAFMKTGVSTAAPGCSHDTCFGRILREFGVDPAAPQEADALREVPAETLSRWRKWCLGYEWPKGQDWDSHDVYLAIADEIRTKYEEPFAQHQPQQGEQHE